MMHQASKLTLEIMYEYMARARCAIIMHDRDHGPRDPIQSAMEGVCIAMDMLVRPKNLFLLMA